jgi:CBS-domain-containing membrane protein
MKADDIMSVDVVAAKDSVTAVEIAARLELEAFNGVPIIDNTGIVTTIELLRAMRDGNFTFLLSHPTILLHLFIILF